MIHITSNNDSIHLHCLQCWCNPVEVTVEGETFILHNTNYEAYGERTTEIQRLMQKDRSVENNIRE